MSDLIDRQAAIGAADSADYTGLSVEDVKKVTDEVVKTLKTLPSAQPNCNKCLRGDIEQHNLQAKIGRAFQKGVEVGQKNTLRWIPCSERLPGDELFYVLCCDKYGEIMIGNVFECDDGETPYTAESEYEYMYDCVAWMPLPTPYREGGQE